MQVLLVLLLLGDAVWDVVEANDGRLLELLLLLGLEMEQQLGLFYCCRSCCLIPAAHTSTGPTSAGPAATEHQVVKMLVVDGVVAGVVVGMLLGIMVLILVLVAAAAAAAGGAAAAAAAAAAGAAAAAAGAATVAVGAAEVGPADVWAAGIKQQDLQQ
jgi:hypothetical protein